MFVGYHDLGKESRTAENQQALGLYDSVKKGLATQEQRLKQGWSGPSAKIFRKPVQRLCGLWFTCSAWLAVLGDICPPVLGQILGYLELMRDHVVAGPD